VDIRPLVAGLKGLQAVAADGRRLPFPDATIQSLSCLHVAEHIGLGRYGDTLDPQGTHRMIRELIRVVAPGGELLFSVPVGRSRVCFNAHRVLDPREIVELFEPLRLDEFALVDDQGVFHRSSSPAAAVGADYSCGLFRFTADTAAPVGSSP
jgi:SAM-dependent methyltransferase